MKEKRNRSIKSARREWLNPIEHIDTGYVHYSVEIPKQKQVKKNGEEPSLTSPCLEASFTIADCTRKANLSFDVWNEKDLEDRKAKLHTFKKIVAQFVADYEKAIEQYELQLKAYKASKPKASAARELEIDDFL